MSRIRCSPVGRSRCNRPKRVGCSGDEDPLQAVRDHRRPDRREARAQRLQDGVGPDRRGRPAQTRRPPRRACQRSSAPPRSRPRRWPGSRRRRPRERAHVPLPDRDLARQEAGEASSSARTRRVAVEPRSATRLGSPSSDPRREAARAPSRAAASCSASRSSTSHVAHRRPRPAAPSSRTIRWRLTDAACCRAS